MSLIAFPAANLQRELSRKLPLGHKLSLVHNELKGVCPFVDRVAVALHDAKTGDLSTFIHSSGVDSPLLNYSVKLKDVPSLQEIAKTGQMRVLNDLAPLTGGTSRHTRKVVAQGYRSSVTYPLFHDGAVIGFLFFNSYQKDVFNDSSLVWLNLYNQVIAGLVIKETAFIRTTIAAIRTVQSLTRHKDEETGSHMERVSHYSRLIALGLAHNHGFSDEYIEYITLFTPMHDIGKIVVPDYILGKPGNLTPEEFAVIKTHCSKGREIIDNMVHEFALDGFLHIPMLCNIVEYHHEAIDGSGYPHGLKAGAIPMEARICAVADIFDALTSRRPYKEPWSNERAFETLLKLSGTKLDQECVQALLDNGVGISETQECFADDRPVRQARA